MYGEDTAVLVALGNSIIAKYRAPILVVAKGITNPTTPMTNDRIIGQYRTALRCTTGLEVET